jgi:hypothetical protein
MIQRVLDDPFIPKWSAAQPGMTVTSEIPDEDEHIRAKAHWLGTLGANVATARTLAAKGIAKSVVNRLLEPWMHIEVVLSATEFNNFFALRDDAAAEPHIRDLAHMMRELRDKSEPTFKRPCVGPDFCTSGGINNVSTNSSEWHLPFIDLSGPIIVGGVLIHKTIKESVAHAAWVSYGSVDGKPGFTQEDVDRVYDKLVGSQPIHASPTEHVAVACNGPHRHGNFTGWCQWRQFLPGQSGGDYLV